VLVRLATSSSMTFTTIRARLDPFGILILPDVAT